MEEARAPILLAITVTPASSRLAVGDTLQFRATGRFSDGSRRDMTQTVQWASSNSSVATIGNASGSLGLVTGLAAGIGTFSDSTTQDITAVAAWSSSNTGVAAINQTGLAVGIQAGQANVTATLAGISGSALTVTEAIARD